MDELIRKMIEEQTVEQFCTLGSRIEDLEEVADYSLDDTIHDAVENAVEAALKGYPSGDEFCSPDDVDDKIEESLGRIPDRVDDLEFAIDDVRERGSDISRDIINMREEIESMKKTISMLMRERESIPVANPVSVWGS